ncbi:hypothetical protein CHS0354_010616 [Potamilus streckersoni]|uniref:Palmitoyltransferase n=1 Tax=Potamilus streckersoni TaxID=2493646 RepID=A0AAE0SH18_9BIVA|nr:hypothetical protein CHS0354_010616 [Potamilus streckersoni]
MMKDSSWNHHHVAVNVNLSAVNTDYANALRSSTAQFNNNFESCEHAIHESRVIVKDLPLIGRVRILMDSHGLKALTFIIIYWIYGFFSTYFIILSPHWSEGRIPDVAAYAYIVISFLCLISLFRASTVNPGAVPLIDKLSTDIDLSKLHDCQSCGMKKPARAHHCRRCQQCVLRMDHHCPWINNCVGEGNHYLFLLLLLYAFLMSALSFTLCVFQFWVFPKCSACLETWYLKPTTSIWFLYVLVLISVAMSIFMGLQFLSQQFNLIMDRTTLENMAVTSGRAILRTNFRSWFHGISDICGTRNAVVWLLPCRRRPAKSIYEYIHAV